MTPRRFRILVWLAIVVVVASMLVLILFAPAEVQHRR